MVNRIGFGFDVHQLVEGRDLWLGGIKIEHTLGLLGHSDADVLIHAICDAILGAANMRDIGYHYEHPNKGNRTYYTVGAGFKMNVFSLDAGYVISTAQSNPLDQTLRFSLAFDMDGIGDLLGRKRRR